MTTLPILPVRVISPASLLAGGGAALVLLAACGGGGGGGSGAAPGSLEGSLNRLGVNTARTARLAGGGRELPPEYSPLGAAVELAKTNELLLLGVDPRQPTPTGTPLTLFELTNAQGGATLEVMHAEGPTAVPWASETRPSRSFPATLRCPVAADLDGDGLQEVAIVRQQGIETRVFTIEDEPTGHATRDVHVATVSNVTNVAAAAGDLDGDGDDELVVGLTQAGQGLLLILDVQAGTLVERGTRRTFDPVLAGSTLELRLCCGNLDFDRSEEIAVAVTEYVGTTGAARFAVLDDLGRGLAVLRQGEFTGRDRNGLSHVGLCASVAIGDVDGDNLGEVLLGGVTAYTRHCNAAPYFLLALDDAEHGLVDLAGHAFSHFYPGCDSPNDPQVRTVHLNVLDIDGDGRMEVQANQFVFQDFVEAQPWTEVTQWRLPDAAMWQSGNFAHFDTSTSSMATGDFTGDNRGDIVIYRQDTNFVDVWGLPQTQTTVSRLRRFEVSFRNSQVPINPFVVPVNVDTDSPVLKYSDGEYRLVFSEPVVLAALAAPPTHSAIPQNVAGSYTAFGNTTTTGSVRERSISFSVSASVGVKLDGGPLTQSEFELRDTLTVSAARTMGTAYELSKTIIFTSAPTEDTIVFSCVPLDQWIYTVVSHPDPELIGRRVVVSLPRAPVTLQAERGFYNGTVQAGSLQIDDRVFDHQIGSPSSYPTRAEKNQRLSTHGGGLEIGPQSVGQGGGTTEVTLQVGTAVSRGGSLAMNYQRDVQVTGGGVLFGLGIGVENTSTWQVTSGTSTTYTGVVGAIEGSHFATHRYSFGLFTHVQRDAAGGQQFQVLNYWVE